MQGVPVWRPIQAPALRAVLLPGYRSSHRAGAAARGGWRSGVVSAARLVCLPPPCSDFKHKSTSKCRTFRLEGWQKLCTLQGAVVCHKLSQTVTFVSAVHVFVGAVCPVPIARGDKAVSPLSHLSLVYSWAAPALFHPPGCRAKIQLD